MRKIRRGNEKSLSPRFGTSTKERAERNIVIIKPFSKFDF
jgi:hypothetical protein